MSEQYLLLKWGTLKGWDVTGNEKAKAALREFHEDPVPLSVMAHRPTDRQKIALCAAIDAVAESGGEVQNDWSGENMTPDEAKAYVMEYRA